MESVTTLARAFAPLGSATLKQTAEDFRVDELASFEPDGAGEHVYLLIEKRNTNTDWLAKHLAQHAGISPRDVGYSGLKDRQALTTQWFSILVRADKEPNWQALENDQIRVLKVTRHGRKLRTGAHSGNHFSLLLRDIEADAGQIEQRLSEIRRTGIPNYFAAQRFGHGAANLQKADALLTGKLRVNDRKKRGLYLSAARSQIFNEVLHARVLDGSWCQALPGDCMILNGSNSFFSIEQVDEVIRKRMEEMDIHPSGPLPGTEIPQTTARAADYELAVYQRYTTWFAGFARAGMREHRRALRLPIGDLAGELREDGLRLSFKLPPGAYATTLVAELFTTA